MDLLELGDTGSGCEDENGSITSGFLESCSNPECQWEESVFGFTELVCMTLIYIPLMIFGLLGNILTILVVWLRPHMRSSTYLYLSSMAVSDLLILLLLPLDLYKLWRPRPWPLGDLACKLTMFLSECCTFCTILHITFLSLERYVAVCWPITAKTLVTRRRTRTVIGCLWLGAVVSAAPVLVMVGVEEVGAEELGLGGWSEGGDWAGREGEHREFMLGGRERHIGSMDEVVEGIHWGEKTENNGWGERAGESGEKGERKQGLGERDERKRDEGGDEEEGEVKVEGERQNKMKEDEGGGREEGVDGGHGGITDMRECRCTHYAVSSGLLSAMMILSNLYFLVPVCILGLVYSLIGRALWLRPQSSRRDQSHRHTVKMLGVIVLAFVLCWLPFHVGRTIFSFEYDRLETYTDTNPQLDINTLSNASVDRNINTHTGVDTHLADTETETQTDARTQAHDMSADKHVYSRIVSHTRGQHINTDTSTHNVDPSTETETTTHAETHNVGTQLERFTDDRDTNTSTYNDTHKMTHINEQVSHLNTSFHGDTKTHTRCTVHTNTNTPTVLYNDNTQNDSLINNTYTHPDTDYFLYYLSQYFNLVSSVLFYLSAAVNPLLYNLMSARYRHAIHSLIHTHPHTHSHRLPTLSAQHSTTTI